MGGGGGPRRSRSGRRSRGGGRGGKRGDVWAGVIKRMTQNCSLHAPTLDENDEDSDDDNGSMVTEMVIFGLSY